MLRQQIRVALLTWKGRLVLALMVLVVLVGGGYTVVRHTAATPSAAPTRMTAPMMATAAQATTEAHWIATETAQATMTVAQGATSLEIIAWRIFDAWLSNEQRPPDVKVFDRTFTNQELAQTLQDQFNALQRNVVGGCSAPQVSYRYEFAFATYGTTTQVYTGDIACTIWTVTTFGVKVGVGAPEGASFEGYNLMTTLRKLTGMPLPSWWSATLPAN